jgi:hypothetical protein
MNYLKEAQKQRNYEVARKRAERKRKMMTMVNLPSDNDE